MPSPLRRTRSSRVGFGQVESSPRPRAGGPASVRRRNERDPRPSPGDRLGERPDLPGFESIVHGRFRPKAVVDTRMVCPDYPLMRASLALAILCLGAGGCVYAGLTDQPDLSVVAAQPEAFYRRTVRLCGWATNQFEDQSILASPNSAVGLEVSWCRSSAKTEKREWRCVTGVIRPIGGATPKQLVDPAWVTVSNASPFVWEIREKAC